MSGRRTEFQKSMLQYQYEARNLRIRVGIIVGSFIVAGLAAGVEAIAHHGKPTEVEVLADLAVVAVGVGTSPLLADRLTPTIPSDPGRDSN